MALVSLQRQIESHEGQEAELEGPPSRQHTAWRNTAFSLLPEWSVCRLAT